VSKLGLIQRSFLIGVLVLFALLIVLVVDTAVGVGDYATDQDALMDGLLTGLAPLMLLTCMGWQEAAMAQRSVVNRRSGGNGICYVLDYLIPVLAALVAALGVRRAWRFAHEPNSSG
jgi:hypothetical protein